MTIHFATLPKGFDLPPGLTLRPAKAARKPGTASKPRRRPKSPAKAPEPLEREIQRSIVGYLESLGAVVIRINSGAVKTDGRFTRFNSLPGCPDLLAALPQCLGPAVFLAIEVKRPRGKVTDMQDAAQTRLTKVGAVVIVARCVEDVRTVLEKEGLL